MIKTVVCSDCGAKFGIREDEDSYYPPKCPQCDKTILEVKTTPTSEDYLAQVEE
jgi:phage FluMu protein Com